MTHDFAQVLPVFMQAAEPELPVGDRVISMGDTPEVRALIASAREGNQDAFGALVAMHERIVFRTALAALGAREDAEDAAQEAFVMAWRRIGAFRGDSTFKTWLLTITWRKALDRRRARKAWWSRTSAPWRNDDDADPLDSVPTSTPSPERAAMASHLAERAEGLIQTLSPKLRDALLLAASGEYRYEDIATILAVPLGTVKWRVSEARRILSSQLER